jgi:NitT/TauT family transport system substrate-binding protein
MLASTPAMAEKLPRLILAGPSSSVSNPLIHMVESGALNDLAEQVEFISWRDPDQLRLMALNGKADVLAMPVNVAANLYNRGAKLRLLNVSTWGLLWLVSRDPGLTTMGDLRGKEITMPFRGDMPDILFGLLADREGLDLRKDLRVRYVATPMDAMQLLLMRRTDHVLLAEPAISMALRKAGSGPLSLVAPELHRSIDLQKEWGRLLQREARIPQAGIALMASIKDDPVIASRIADAYAASLQWCGEHAEDCGQMVAKHMPMLSAEAVTDSLAVAHMQAVPAAQAQAEVEFFLEQLLQKNPALIGGKLPPADFYTPTTAP